MYVCMYAFTYKFLYEWRVDLFTFNKVYRIVCLAYCIYFFSPNGFERYRSFVRFSERTHPRASLILQNGIADDTPEVDRPKRAVPDAPSSLFPLHSGWSTGTVDLQLQLLRAKATAAYETLYGSLKNAKCNNGATPTEHDATYVGRKKTIR